MGCSASKTVTHSVKNPDHYCSSAPNSVNSSPATAAVGRAFSLPTPLVHHPPLKKGDTHHLVSLTSTTYGSLLLIDRPTTTHFRGGHRNGNLQPPQPPPLDTKGSIPQPMDSEQSLSPDSVINTWELMDGLDDDDFVIVSDQSEIDKPIPAKPSANRENRFNGYLQKSPQAETAATPAVAGESLKSSEIEEDEIISSFSSPSPSPKKPLWKHISEESFLSKLDPNVSLSYFRALSSRTLTTENQRNKLTKSVEIESSRLSSSFSNNWPKTPNQIQKTQNKILIYFTSLRGIRKTYEDCCLVRMIFRGFRVQIDERDISMDSLYRKELQSKLGGKPLILPQVFIRGKHIGGSEEIKQLHESGELSIVLDGFPIITDPNPVCHGCGDARFVPCGNCNGSRKLFDDEDGKLKRCPDCNENGLIKCPVCCSF